MDELDNSRRMKLVELYHATQNGPDPPSVDSFLELCGAGAEIGNALRAFLADEEKVRSWVLDAPPLTDSSGHPRGEQGLVAERYRILAKLDRGGYGIVDLAWDKVGGKNVVIKWLKCGEEMQQRIIKEARAIQSVDHENIVRLYNVELGDRNNPFLVMEYCAAGTLEEYIREKGRMAVDEIVSIGLQLAKGLAAAHAKDLIHCDVKPRNILRVDETGRVKLADFGLALHERRAKADGLVHGTPAYMSPEQAKGQQLDCRSDLFSLGSVLYKMCTGIDAFRGESAENIRQQVIKGTPASIEDQAPDTPDWLVAMVTRLLDKSPEHRYQTAAEVAREFEKHCYGDTSEITRRFETWFWKPFRTTVARNAVVLLYDSNQLRDLPATVQLARYLDAHHFEGVDFKFLTLGSPDWKDVDLDRCNAVCLVGRPSLHGFPHAKLVPKGVFSLPPLPRNRDGGDAGKQRKIDGWHNPNRIVTEETAVRFHHVVEESDGCVVQHKTVQQQDDQGILKRTDHGIIQRMPLKIGSRRMFYVTLAGASSLGTLAAIKWVTTSQMDGMFAPPAIDDDTRVEVLIQTKARVHDPPKPWEPEFCMPLKILVDGRDILHGPEPEDIRSAGN